MYYLTRNNRLFESKDGFSHRNDDGNPILLRTYRNFKGTEIQIPYSKTIASREIKIMSEDIMDIIEKTDLIRTKSGVMMSIEAYLRIFGENRENIGEIWKSSSDDIYRRVWKC